MRVAVWVATLLLLIAICGSEESTVALKSTLVGSVAGATSSVATSASDLHADSKGASSPGRWDPDAQSLRGYEGNNAEHALAREDSEGAPRDGQLASETPSGTPSKSLPGGLEDELDAGDAAADGTEAAAATNGHDDAAGIITCPLLHPKHDSLTRFDDAIAVTAPFVARCKLLGSRQRPGRRSGGTGGAPASAIDGDADADDVRGSGAKVGGEPWHAKCASAESDLLSYQQGQQMVLARRYAILSAESSPSLPSTSARAGSSGRSSTVGLPLLNPLPIPLSLPSHWSGTGYPSWFTNYTVRGAPVVMSGGLGGAGSAGDGSCSGAGSLGCALDDSLVTMLRDRCSGGSGCSVDGLLSAASNASLTGDDSTSPSDSASVTDFLSSLRLPGFLAQNYLYRLTAVAANMEAGPADGGAGGGGGVGGARHDHHAHPRREGVDNSDNSSSVGRKGTNPTASKLLEQWSTTWPRLHHGAHMPVSRAPAGLHRLLAPTHAPIVVRLFHGQIDVPLLHPLLLNADEDDEVAGDDGVAASDLVVPSSLDAFAFDSDGDDCGASRRDGAGSGANNHDNSTASACTSVLNMLAGSIIHPGLRSSSDTAHGLFHARASHSSSAAGGAGGGWSSNDGHSEYQYHRLAASVRKPHIDLLLKDGVNASVFRDAYYRGNSSGGSGSGSGDNTPRASASPAAGSVGSGGCPIRHSSSLLARGWRTVLQPGQTLFVPSGYAVTWRAAAPASLNKSPARSAGSDSTGGAADAPPPPAAPALVLDHAWIDASNVQAVMSTLLSSLSTLTRHSHATLLQALELGFSNGLLDTSMARLPAQYVSLGELRRQWSRYADAASTAATSTAAAADNAAGAGTADDGAANSTTSAAAADTDAASSGAGEAASEVEEPEAPLVQQPGESDTEFRRRKRKAAEAKAAAQTKQGRPKSTVSGRAGGSGGGRKPRSARLREWHDEKRWAEYIARLSEPGQPLSPVPVAAGRDNVTIMWHVPPTAKLATGGGTIPSAGSSSPPARHTFAVYFTSRPIADERSQSRAEALSQRYREGVSAAAEARARRAFQSRRLREVLADGGAANGTAAGNRGDVGDGGGDDTFTVIGEQGQFVSIATRGRVSRGAADASGDDASAEGHGDLRGFDNDDHSGDTNRRLEQLHQRQRQAAADPYTIEITAHDGAPLDLALLIATLQGDRKNVSYDAEAIRNASGVDLSQLITEASGGNSSGGGSSGRRNLGAWRRSLTGSSSSSSSTLSASSLRRWQLWEHQLDNDVMEAARRLQAVALEASGLHLYPSCTGSSGADHAALMRDYLRPLPGPALRWAATAATAAASSPSASDPAAAGSEQSSSPTGAAAVLLLDVDRQAMGMLKRSQSYGYDADGSTSGDDDDGGGHASHGLRILSPASVRFDEDCTAAIPQSSFVSSSAPVFAGSGSGDEAGQDDDQHHATVCVTVTGLLPSHVYSFAVAAAVSPSSPSSSSAGSRIGDEAPPSQSPPSASSSPLLIGPPSLPSPFISTHPLLLCPPLTGPPSATAIEPTTVQLSWAHVLPGDTGGLPLLGWLVTREDSDSRQGIFAHHAVLPAVTIGMIDPHEAEVEEDRRRQGRSVGGGAGGGLHDQQQRQQQESRGGARGHRQKRARDPPTAIPGRHLTDPDRAQSASTTSTVPAQVPAVSGSILGLHPNATYRFVMAPITAVGVGKPSPPTHFLRMPPLQAPGQQWPGGRVLAYFSGRGRIQLSNHGKRSAAGGVDTGSANAAVGDDHGTSGFDPTSPVLSVAHEADRLAVIAQLHAAVSIAFQHVRDEEKRQRQRHRDGGSANGNDGPDTDLRASELLERSGLGDGALDTASSLDRYAQTAQSGVDAGSSMGGHGTGARRLYSAGINGLGHAIGPWFGRSAYAVMTESGVEMLASEVDGGGGSGIRAPRAAATGGSTRGDDSDNGASGVGAEVKQPFLLPGVGGLARYVNRREATVKAMLAQESEAEGESEVSLPDASTGSAGAGTRGDDVKGRRTSGDTATAPAGASSKAPNRSRGRRPRLLPSSTTPADNVPTSSSSSTAGSGEAKADDAMPPPTAFSTASSSSSPLDPYHAMATASVGDYVRALASAYERQLPSGLDSAVGAAASGDQGELGTDGRVSGLASRGLVCRGGTCRSPVADTLHGRLQQSSAGNAHSSASSVPSTILLPCISPLITVSDVNQTVTVHMRRSGAHGASPHKQAGNRPSGSAGQFVAAAAPTGATTEDDGQAFEWVIPAWSSAYSPRSYDIMGEAVAAVPLTGAEYVLAPPYTTPRGEHPLPPAQAASITSSSAGSMAVHVSASGPSTGQTDAPYSQSNLPLTLTDLPLNQGDMAGRIAIFERGRPLPLADKVRRAAAAGASAVIIIDDHLQRCGVESRPLFHQGCVQGGSKEQEYGWASSDAPEAWGGADGIPAVLVTRDAGLRLLSLLA